MKKRLICLILVLVLIMSVLPEGALADTEPEAGEGSEQITEGLPEDEGEAAEEPLGGMETPPDEEPPEEHEKDVPEDGASEGDSNKDENAAEAEPSDEAPVDELVPEDLPAQTEEAPQETSASDDAALANAHAEDVPEDAEAAVLTEDAGSCDLKELHVAVGSSPSKNTELTLSPTFSSDGTEYTVDAFNSSTMQRCYVKASAADSSAVITAQLNSGSNADVTSGSSSWKTVGTALSAGEYNVLTVTVAASADENAETKTYTVTIPMKDSAGKVKTLTGIAITTPPAKTEYNVGESFDNRGMVVTAYYDDDSTKTLTYYGWDPREIAADTEVITVSYNGQTAEVPITVNVPVTSYNTTITVPSDATLFVGQKSKRDNKDVHFMPFTPVEPKETSTDSDAGTTTYSFDLTAGTYNYRVSGAEYVTYAGTFSKNDSNDYSLTVTDTELKPDGKTKTTVDHDVSSNDGYNVADIYLNINAQGYLKLNSGDTYQLVNLRIWETTNTVTDNYFIEPDYHYTVIDTSGNPSNSVVTVDDSGLVTAVGNGAAIVLVTYDAINVTSALGGPFFGAIWPENTGVFVVSVGAGNSGINTGMTINEGKNNTENKLSGNALDSEHDIIYFTGDSGSYTFTPVTAGCSVDVANPTVDTEMSFSGFEPASANSDGSFTVPLTEGRNIVKISNGAGEEYQVITAKKVKIAVNKGEAVHPGDDITITFDSIYHPASKLAGVYNMATAIEYTNVGGEKTSVGSTSSQYQFASTNASQTVSGTLERTETSFSVTYEAEGTITVPADYSSDTFTMSGGTIIADGFGDPYGSHRSIKIDEGREPNFSASIRTARLGQLPDIEIPIVFSGADVDAITLDTTNVKTAYYEGDSFDTTNLVVTAKYSDGTTGTVTNYTVTPSVLTAETKQVTITYKEKTADIPVTVTPLEVASIKITTPPSQTAYISGSVFNPTGMVVTATYKSGAVKAIGDYKISPARELTVDDSFVTVTYGGLTAATPITVTPALPGSSSITVSFTLYGDELHGTPEDEAGTHTLRKGNLTAWIARTSVTVPKGSKVIDVFSKALGLAGIPYENPSGNYITYIRGLGEFSNGSLSGWMYTLNGVHPNLGVNEQFVDDGDVIVFHYTDDYTKERDSENWTSGGSYGGAAANPEDKIETTLSPEVEANDKGEANAVIDETVLNNTIADAKAGKADSIVITPEVKGEASKISVELPKSGVDNAAKQTDADLKVETDIADITIPQKSLDDLAGKSGSKVTISAESVKGTDNVKLEVAIDGKSVNKLSGGISVSVPAETENSGNVLAIVNDDGTEKIVKKSIVDGKSVEALLDGSCTVKVVDNSKHFDDTADHWSKDAVAFASSHELFSGTGANTFSPDIPMSRAMLVTVLYRLEDVVATGSNAFTDVPEGTWYTDAVTWASNAGIVTGTGSGFDPNGNVSREELATMLYRCAKALGISTGASGDLSKFSDGGKTSSWAKDAMSWAVGSGLISGKGNGILDPTGSATRAEVAVTMQRLIGLVVK